MADRIVIPLGNGDWIALARRRSLRTQGRSPGVGASNTLHPQSDNGQEPLCTAAELAATVLKVAKTKIEQGHPAGTDPAVRVGRYYRYRRREVEAALMQQAAK